MCVCVCVCEREREREILRGSHHAFMPHPILFYGIISISTESAFSAWHRKWCIIDCICYSDEAEELRGSEDELGTEDEVEIPFEMSRPKPQPPQKPPRKEKYLVWLNKYSNNNYERNNDDKEEEE